MSLTVEKCLQAWTNSLRQMKAKADIVFFGDSLTYYGDFSNIIPNRAVCNLGLRGDTIQGMIDRVEQVKMLEPKMVFIMAGINDVGECSIRDFKNRYELLLKEVQAISSSISIFVQGMLPINDKVFKISCTNKQIIECNEQIRTIAESLGFHYIDLFSKYQSDGQLDTALTIDGLHLKESAYEGWYSVLKSIL